MRAVTVGIGIVGCGRIARLRHLPLLARMRTARVVALADTDPAALAGAADEHRVARRYRTHEELLADDAVDAVLVCTPPGQHVEAAADALRAGRHLYVDSPLALSIEDCDRLLALADATDRIATVGLNLRHHSHVERALRLVEAGDLGRLQAVNAVMTTPSRGMRGDVFPAWRRPDSIEGNVFVESAIQHFDIWRLLTGGEFAEIRVHQAHPPGPVSVSAALRRRADSAGAPEFTGRTVVAGAVFSEYSGDTCEIRLIGERATLSLSLYRYDGFAFRPSLEPPGSPRQHLRALAERLRSLPRGVANLVRGGEYGVTFERQLEAFVRGCAGGEPPPVTLRDGRAATAAALAAFESMASGRTGPVDAAPQERGSSRIRKSGPGAQ